VFSYDPEILAAVSTSPDGIPGVIRAMQTIDALCADTDGLKWFNRLYLRVTESVAARAATGGFRDSAWMAQLDVLFAGLYFDALRCAFSGARAPGCWRALFDRRDTVAIAPVQFAVAGVNAHINHDLAMAIEAACLAAGIAPSHDLPQYADYTALNATLESLVDDEKRELALRLPGDGLPAVSRLEDTIAAFSLTAAREAAWNHAELLWAVRGLPLLHNRAIATVDGMTAFASKTLLAPIPA